MTAPSVICQTSGGTITPGNPCHLSPAASGLLLGDWRYLINFQPPADVVTHLQTRFSDGDDNGDCYHHIEKAHGDINLDFYAVYIHRLPVIDGVQVTNAELLRYLRVHLDNFMNHSEVWFSNYELEDLAKWESDAPLGAVMSFQMGGGGRLWDPEMNPDNASVVASEVTSDHWIFTPLWTPNDENHPVSGNRQFGLAVRKPQDSYPRPYDSAFADVVTCDTLYFYARGADRCTGVLDRLVSGTVFAGGDSCWVGAFAKLRAWIEANGGSASVPGRFSERYDWDTIKTAYWTGSGP